MKVSAVVVTYNRLKLLKECLYNLLNQHYGLEKIFVINNKSTDGTKEYLDNLKNNKIITINSNKNLGGAGGFSLGIETAYEKSDCDYLWLMDDDTMPTSSSLWNMMIKAKELHYNFGFLCSNVRYWKDNTSSVMNVPVVKDNWNNKSSSGLIQLKSASFVSILISRKAVSKLGLPISEMFIWADDVEYTTRISRYFPSYYVSQSVVIHKCNNNNNNESITNVDVNRLFYYKCMFRNRLYICKRYYNKRQFIKRIISLLSNIIIILFKTDDHRLKRILYTISGVWNGIFFNPNIKFPK